MWLKNKKTGDGDGREKYLAQDWTVNYPWSLVEYKGLKWTHLGCGLGRLGTSGLEERDNSSKSDPAQTGSPVERWPVSFLLGLLFSQITSGLRPESLAPSVGLPCFCFPSPMQPLVLMDVQTLCKQFGTAQLAEIICLFWMSNFMFVASFPCTERYCLVSASAFWQMFTFPRERHHSLEVMSAGAPHALWEHKPVFKGGGATEACTIATEVTICRCLSSEPAFEVPLGGSVYTPRPTCIMHSLFPKWAF